MPLGAFHVRLGDGISRQTYVCVERAFPQRSFRRVSQVKQTILLARIIAVIDTVFLARLATHIDQQVHTHRRRDDHPSVLRLVWIHRLTVDGDHLRVMFRKVQRKRTGVGNIHKAQTDAFTGTHRLRLRHHAIDCYRITQPTRVGGVMHIAKSTADLRIT